MSRIAIVAAMHEELSALLAAMPDEAPVRRAGREFWVGHLDGHDVVAVLSRVGKVAAATTATLLVSEFDIGCAVFTGTAGGLHESARVGDVVVADALLQHDLDASPIFPRYEVPLYGVDRFRTDAALSSALVAASQAVLDEAAQNVSTAAETWPRPRSSALVRHRLAAGSQRPRRERRPLRRHAAEGADLRRRLPEALAVEMEGAAVAQVCHDLAVPFAVVRTVSDRADDAAHVDFGRFVAQVASRYSLAIVRRWLRDLKPRAVPMEAR